MKNLCTALAAAGLAAAAALPVHAASHGADPAMMTCADFMAMDSEGQMKAAHEIEMASMKSDDMAADEMASDEKTGDEEMATEEMSSGEMTSNEMSSTMEGEGMMGEEAAMTITSACDGHPDMSAMDAMMSDMN